MAAGRAALLFTNQTFKELRALPFSCLSESGLLWAPRQAQEKLLRTVENPHFEESVLICSMAESSQVVIVGGGVAGCSTAYYLACAGVKSTVVEREGIASQASGFSAGGLNPLEGAHIPGLLAPLAIESYRLHGELWENLEAETGIEFQGRITEMVKLAFSEAEIPDLRVSFERFRNALSDGFSARWLEAPDLRELEPRLSREVICGVSLYGNRALDSLKYTGALADAAEKRGAVIRKGSVQGFRKDGNRVRAVSVEDGEIACEQVVLAVGPWSRELGEELNVNLPVDPLKGEMLRLELPGPPLPCDFSSGGSAIYAKPDGLVWCGTTEELRGFDREPSESARVSIMRGALIMMPALAQAELVKHTACLRPMTTDAMPVIGRPPGWDNVFLTTGAGRKGILLSTGMGKAIADLVTVGETELSIEPCSPNRFA